MALKWCFKCQWFRNFHKEKQGKGKPPIYWCKTCGTEQK